MSPQLASLFSSPATPAVTLNDALLSHRPHSALIPPRSRLIPIMQQQLCRSQCTAPRAARPQVVPVCIQRPSPAACAAPVGRRESLAGLLALTGGLVLLPNAPAHAAPTPAPQVGTLLPKDESLPGFVRYTPDSQRTPVRGELGVLSRVCASEHVACVGCHQKKTLQQVVLTQQEVPLLQAIRAGVIKPNPEYYSFALPETWSEQKISNTLSGNFCMPRCDEPWVEAIYADEKEGKMQVKRAQGVLVCNGGAA